MTNESFTGAVSERASGDGLEPDTLLPSQFFRGDPGGASVQPEKRLMLAVLEEALGTFQKLAAARTRDGQQLFADVEEWIAADDMQWPFSFLNICHAVSLEPAYLRAGLRRWRDRLRTASDSPSIVIRSPFRHTTGSRTRAKELRRSRRFGDRRGRQHAALPYDTSSNLATVTATAKSHLMGPERTTPPASRHCDQVQTETHQIRDLPPGS